MSGGAAVVYCRVSTEKQATEGVSLDAQEARARAWAQAAGRDVLAVRVDHISGKRADNRPELQSALREVCAEPGRALVVYSLSRLARSTTDAIGISERLQRAGADLVSLSESIDTTTPMGRFAFTIFAAFGQLEREVLSDRTKMGLAYKRTKGEHLGGGAPLGFRVEPGRRDPSGKFIVPPKLVEVPEEQAARYAARLLRVGGLSLRSVSETLAASGLVARNGRPYAAAQVARLVRA